MKTICWFRQDLRVGDNPALAAASKNGSVIPVFIVDPEDRPLGGASKWWLHNSLASLAKDLGGLVLKRGEPSKILSELVEQTGAQAIAWNRCYEPHAVKRDTKLKQQLRELGVEVQSFSGSVIYEPWQIETGSGGPYKVYTPFWKAIQAKGFPDPQPAPEVRLAEIAGMSDPLDEWQLLPEKPNWAEGWNDLWQPGEAGARDRLEEFLNENIEGYDQLRNRPDLPNVSRLSPHIHFGEISPRQICARAMFFAGQNPQLAGDIQKFVSEVAWRDFANHLLFHFPEIPEKNWKPAFDQYPWREDPVQLTAWQTGQTGYPMVDAGMRELWQTGYMHNRVRMIVASFLVKHLQMHWKHGEEWFWDTLLDADLANNTASWQWVTGSGADAAPYFRIFNPYTQGEKFDPQSEYVRKWCPELSKLPNEHIHMPHQAPKDVLEHASVILGETYPLPIVDHKKAREAALAGYEKVKQAG